MLILSNTDFHWDLLLWLAKEDCNYYLTGISLYFEKSRKILLTYVKFIKAY